MGVPLGLVAFILAGVVVVSCEKVPLMSPDGAQLNVQANPPFVPANGGRSLVTAVLTDGTGLYVADGTEVYFFTNLGSIDAGAKTVNGLARAYFVADGRSGTACVVVYSGGKAPAVSGDCSSSGGGSTTTTTTPTTTTTAGVPVRSAAKGMGGMSGAVAASSVSGQGSATVKIDVGSALPKLAIVTAQPARITQPRHTTIVVTVYDANGNPVQNVPVLFTISRFGVTLEETLDSGGAPQYTDSSGRTFDVLRTRASLLAAPKTVDVTATIPGVAAEVVTVTIN